MPKPAQPHMQAVRTSSFISSLTSSSTSGFTSSPARSCSAWCWLLLAAGSVLAAHALHLVLGYGTLHFGVVVLALCGAACLAAAGLLWRYGGAACRQWARAAVWRWRLCCALAVALGAWLCSVALFFVFISRAQADASYAVAPPKHAVIVVLGSGAPYCQPSATLQARLDRALELAQRLPHARVLATGGKIAWQPCTEGQVMGNYLRAHGLQAGRIVQEERSTSTQENLRFSLPVLQAHGFNQQAHTLLLVTSDFHAMRARLIARREGYSHIQSASAPTPLPQRYAAWLREYFAFISGWLLKEY